MIGDPQGYLLFAAGRNKPPANLCAALLILRAKAPKQAEPQ